MAWRRLTLVLAAAAGSLLVATPAMAAAIVDVNIVLKPAHQNQTAKGFGSQDCGGPLASLPDGKDGWHLILPSATGEDFKTVDLTFDTDPGAGETLVHVIVDNSPPLTSDSNPGEGWEAFFDDTGSGAVKHLYVITNSGGR